MKYFLFGFLVYVFLFFAIIIEYKFSIDNSSFFFFRHIFPAHGLFLYDFAVICFSNLLRIIISIFIFTIFGFIILKIKQNFIYEYLLSLIFFLPIFISVLSISVYIGIMNSIPTEKQITEYQQKINENSTINIFPHGKIVELVKKESNFIQNLPIKEHIKVTKEITNQIRNQGGPLNSKEHYLRNSIDIAPNTLEEMLSKNGSDKIKWKILSPLMTAYHMFGENGQFNLKFVSDDGFYEAVYDYSGNLITDKKDAVNMATYNYADAITEPKKHLEYDVIPYWIWGNTGTDRKFEIRELVVNVSKFYSNKEVMIRYDKIAKKTFELYGVK